MYCNGIDGWMKDEELQWLYDTANQMENVVEIGSWKGRSTHAILSGCKGTVWAIDHFRGSPHDRTANADPKEISKDFNKNVGHFKNLKILRMDSIEASKQFEDKSVDMVFIDGNHTYKAVKADIEVWLPKTKKLLCGHDYSFDGVGAAVHERFKFVFSLPSTRDIWGVPVG